LQGIPKCVCKQDDILIGGNDENENLDILEMVLERVSENNVHIKLPKCDFWKSSTVCLGFEINIMVRSNTVLSSVSTRFSNGFGCITQAATKEC